MSAAATGGDGFPDGKAIVDPAAAAAIEAQGVPLTGSDPRRVAYVLLERSIRG